MPRKVQDHKKLFTKDLEKSGLNYRDAEKFNVIFLEQSDMLVLSGYDVPGAAFVYHDFDGDAEKLAFVRAKLLKAPPRNSWADADSRPPKYWQQANSSSHFYLPCTLPWRDIANDIRQPIYITEGEKKALCGAKNKLNMLAIPGVANWRSSRRFNQSTIEDLDEVMWEGRTVYLCFDADMLTNPHVTKQLSDFSMELADRGVRYIKNVELPPTTHLGAKCGLDDYIQEFGFPAYQRLIDQSKDVKGLATLWELNDKFAFINSTCRIWDFQQRRVRTKYDFFDFTEALVVKTYRQPRGEGDDARPQVVEEKANKLWWEWPQRRTVDRVEFIPGEPAEVTDEQGLQIINTFRGFESTPELGDIQPFLDLFNHVTDSITADERSWLMQYFAWPIQNPTAPKQFAAVMVHSKTQGSGKSYLGECIAAMYGDHGMTIGNPDLLTKSAHNQFLADKLFVVADEVLVGSRNETDKIKNFVTATNFMVNPKYVDAYKAIAYMNWYFTSNHADALKITAEDRRWFVMHAQEARISQKLADQIRNWRSQGGINHLHYYLRNDVDCSKFNPFEPAPITLARDMMVEATLSEAEMWVRNLMYDPDTILSHDNVTINCDLFTELDWRELGILPKGVTSSTVIRNLLAGHPEAFERRQKLWCTKKVPTQLRWSGKKTLWCLRNAHMWKQRPMEEWAAHYGKWLKSTNQYLGNKKPKMG